MKKLITFFCFIFFFNCTFGQITNTSIVANLTVETTDNVSSLTSSVKNTTDLYYSLRYVFSVITYDSNNNTSKQSKEDLFSLDPYQAKNIFEASINTGVDNKIIVLLLVYDENEDLVAKNRVVFNENISEVEEDKPIDGLEIMGIVTDQTKTKIGRDFFDKFYFYYSFNKLNGDQVVKIDEIFTFRRTTKIMITIEDETIFEFFGRPNEEYIDQMAKLTIQRVFKYFETKKKEKSYISQY